MIVSIARCVQGLSDKIHMWDLNEIVERKRIIRYSS